jgi:hypothetical protein
MFAVVARRCIRQLGIDDAGELKKQMSCDRISDENDLF